MSRATPAAPEMSDLLLDLLGKVSDGSVEVDIDSVPFASLDAKTQSIDLQLGPLVSARRANRALLKSEGRLGIWQARKVPGELARRGWRITLYEGGHELLALGRGTSPLTGHVHATPAALWKLRDLV